MENKNEMHDVNPSFLLRSFIAIFIVYLLLYPALGIRVASGDQQTFPQRIVVFPLCAEEILIDMVGVDRIVYVGHQKIEDESYSPTIRMVTHVPGNSWQNSDECQLIQLNPDLIVLDGDLISDYPEVFPSLVQKGVRFLFVDEPGSINDIKLLISQIGCAVGENERAHEMVQNLEASLNEIACFVDNNSMDKYDVIAYVGEPASLWDDIISVAKVSQLSGEHVSHPDDPSELKQWNPDVILFCPYCLDTDGSYLSGGQEYISDLLNQYLGDPGFSSINAVRNGQLHPLSIFTSHYIVYSIRDLLRYVYR